MNIIEVKITDFKAIKNLDKKIKGLNVFLRGDNGVGKSSFMQFIEIALGKTSLAPPNTNIEGQVITDKEGRTYVFDVKVDQKTGKPKVTVTLPEGTRDTNKSVIAGIVGANSFDIDRFVNLSLTPAGRKEQVEQFKQFLDIETREFLAKYEASVKVHYEERTELNRDITKLQGSVKLHPLYNYQNNLGVFKPIETDLVLQQLKAVNEKNQEVDRIAAGIETKANQVNEKRVEIAELQAKINKLNLEAEALDEDIKKGTAWLGKHPKASVEALEQQIQTASETNEKANQAQNLAKELAKLETLTNEAGELTVLIETERQTIQDAIRDMDGPITGLSFDEDQLLYNGIPVHPQSLSKSEIKKLGIRLKIAENPDLPLFIHEAECMGTESLKEVQTLAEECGLQMFAEEVKRQDKKQLIVEIIGESQEVAA